MYFGFQLIHSKVSSTMFDPPIEISMLKESSNLEVILEEDGFDVICLESNKRPKNLDHKINKRTLIYGANGIGKSELIQHISNSLFLMEDFDKKPEVSMPANVVIVDNVIAIDSAIYRQQTYISNSYIYKKKTWKLSLTDNESSKEIDKFPFPTLKPKHISDKQLDYFLKALDLDPKLNQDFIDKIKDIICEFFYCLNTRGTCIYRNLGNNLHPSLTRMFFDLFSHAQGQLVCTTNETVLLRDLCGENISEVWLLSKQYKPAGKSEIQRMSAYQEAPFIMQGYLDGRYGAVPVFDCAVDIAEELSKNVSR